MRGAIFDLDGTLVDSSGDLIAAANATLARAGRAGRLDPARDQGVSGRGGKAMLRLGLERSGIGEAEREAETEALYHPFLADYEKTLAARTRLFPGVEACLDRLASEGWALAICTNKPERMAVALLDALGVLGRFAAVLGADSLPVRKPDPRPYAAAVANAGGEIARSFLVGDTETDRKTAAAAGVRVALVAFGPEGEGLSRLAPEAMLAHFDDLPALAQNWLGT